MLSFSNFGSSKHPHAKKMSEAARLVREKYPDLMIDGEMNADLAIEPDIQKEHYPFSKLQGSANVLIFPDLQSSNISYKLDHRLSGAEAIGPILVCMEKPVHILQIGSTGVQNVANMTAIAVVDAQKQEKLSNLNT